MKAYAGIDLHSTNNYIGIINDKDQRLFKKRLPNNLDVILSALEPFQQDLHGIVVESTYNWYAGRWTTGQWLYTPSGQSVCNQTV